MATDSSIAWTRKTLNPGVFGCEMDGEECADCYAMMMAWRQENMARARGETAGGYIGSTRLTALGPRWTNEVRVEHDRVAPAFASLPRDPCAVFVTSMADLHHDDVPDSFLELVYREMERRPHWFQVLTKRPHNAAGFLHRSGRAGRLPPNVWIGTTAGDPKHAERRLSGLAGVPASNLFVSMEPLLGMINPRRYLGRELWGGGRVRWVITGGKSGRRPVPSHPRWFCLVRDVCADTFTAFLHKQWGLYEPVAPGDVRPTDVGVELDGAFYSMGGLATPGRPGTTTAIMRKVKAVDPAPTLDGRTHLAFPEGWAA